jgi:uncharacterized protein YdeI (YjbR/CyaY-like superfamily)
MKPVYFPSAAHFRRWLKHNHARATELWVGFYRKDTGKGGLTYPEALDEALCFGWIDGIRKMHSSGLKAFAARQADKTGIYAFEQKPQKLPVAYEKKFRANRKAWGFFTAQAPYYQRTAIHKVVSPKQEATRLRWLNLLVSDSASGRRLKALTSPSKRQA